MGQQLGQRSFVYERARSIQDASDLHEGITRMLDVIANAEVDDQVEGAVRKGHLSHIGLEQVRADTLLTQPVRRFTQEGLVDVDAHYDLGSA